MFINALLSFAIAIILTALFSHYSLSWLSPPEVPNDRSLHKKATPQIGGVAILFSISYCLSLLPLEPYLLGLWIGTILIALVSFIDDCQPIPASYRLLTHLLAAFICLQLSDIALPAFALPLLLWQWSATIGFIFSLLFIIWMINLYNFMDGMDGFSGGMSVIGFASLAYIGYQQEALLYAQINAIIASASLGFLVFNFPPARIFMGDIGASSLGFLAASLSLLGVQQQILPWWAAVLLFSPFIIDATLTLFKRLYHREKIWQAHRSHYYQQLVCLGWGHKKTVLWAYLLMLNCSLSVIYLLTRPQWQQLLGLIIWIIIYLLIIWRITALKKTSMTSTN